MFADTNEAVAQEAAPPVMTAQGWQMAETLLFVAALKRGALVDSLVVLNRLKIDVAWKVLLEAGFTVGGTTSREALMAPVQKQLIEAVQRRMTGHELNAAKMLSAAGVDLHKEAEIKLDKELSAEEKIRAAFNALPDRTIGKVHPISVEHRGVIRHFLAYANNVPSAANQRRGLQTPIHLAVVKAGRMIASEQIGPIVNTFTLDGRNVLKETGMPRYASAEDLKQWTDAGLVDPMGMTADGKSRALAGGQTGVNGYSYKGGQFLPSTTAEPGRWKVGKKWITSERELIEPGVMAVQPTPFSRSILASLGAYVQVVDGTLKIRDGVNFSGIPITRDTMTRLGVKGVQGKEEISYGELVDAYNNGQRWFDVQPEALTVTTQNVPQTARKGGTPLTPEENRANSLWANAAELAGQVQEESLEADFQPAEVLMASREWAKNGGFSEAEMRDALIREVEKRPDFRRKAGVLAALRKPVGLEVAAKGDKPEAEAAIRAVTEVLSSVELAKLRETRELLRDSIATKQSRSEEVPKAWIDKLAEADAVLGTDIPTATAKTTDRLAVDMSRWSNAQVVAYELTQEWEKNRVNFVTDKAALGQFKTKLRRVAKQIPETDETAVMRIDALTTKIWGTDYNPKIADIEFLKSASELAGADAEPALYRYALKFRPPAIGAVPKGYVSHVEDNSIPDARHGVIAYERELTAEEVKQYELVPLGTKGAELQLPKLPYAVRKPLEEAMATLRYMANEVKDGIARLDDFEVEIVEANATLSTFETYAEQNGIDRDKALAELGGVPEFAELKSQSPADALRTLWDEQGVSKEKQEVLLAQIVDKAKPGASVGPFKVADAKDGDLKPADTPLQQVDMEQLIKVAADSIEQLRKVDVLRVLESNRRNAALARYIAEKRPDLVQEVREVMEGEFGIKDWMGTGKNAGEPAPAKMSMAGVYASLEAFEKDTQPFGVVANFAAAMSGMGRDWQSHGKSLREVLDAMKPATSRDWQLEKELSDPGFARMYRGAFADARGIIETFKEIDGQNSSLRILDKVRGPWALDMINRVAEGGRYFGFSAESLGNYVSDSKAYAKLKANTKPEEMMFDTFEDSGEFVDRTTGEGFQLTSKQVSVVNGYLDAKKKATTENKQTGQFDLFVSDGEVFVAVTAPNSNEWQVGKLSEDGRLLGAKAGEHRYLKEFGYADRIIHLVPAEVFKREHAQRAAAADHLAEQQANDARATWFKYEGPFNSVMPSLLIKQNNKWYRGSEDGTLLRVGRRAGDGLLLASIAMNEGNWVAGEKVNLDVDGKIIYSADIDSKQTQKQVNDVVPAEMRVSKGLHIGKVVEITDQHVIQDSGRGKLVAHERSQFDKVPVVGDPLTVSYKGGQGIVISPPERDCNRPGRV